MEMISAALIPNIEDALSEKMVVEVPTFEIDRLCDVTSNMKELQALRMLVAQPVDFEGMGSGRLHLNKVLQRHYLKVDECGINAQESLALIDIDLSQSRPYTVMRVGRVQDANGTPQGAAGYLNSDIFPGDVVVSIESVMLDSLHDKTAAHSCLQGPADSLVDIVLVRRQDHGRETHLQIKLKRDCSSNLLGTGHQHDGSDHLVPVLSCNRPFFAVLRDAASGAVLSLSLGIDTSPIHACAHTYLHAFVYAYCENVKCARMHTSRCARILRTCMHEGMRSADEVYVDDDITYLLSAPNKVDGPSEHPEQSGELVEAKTWIPKTLEAHQGNKITRRYEDSNRPPRNSNTPRSLRYEHAQKDASLQQHTPSWETTSRSSAWSDGSLASSATDNSQPTAPSRTRRSLPPHPPPPFPVTQSSSAVLPPCQKDPYWYLGQNTQITDGNARTAPTDSLQLDSSIVIGKIWETKCRLRLRLRDAGVCAH
jgi:hypothetical protein